MKSGSEGEDRRASCVWLSMRHAKLSVSVHLCVKRRPSGLFHVIWVPCFGSPLHVLGTFVYSMIHPPLLSLQLSHHDDSSSKQTVRLDNLACTQSVGRVLTLFCALGNNTSTYCARIFQRHTTHRTISLSRHSVHERQHSNIHNSADRRKCGVVGGE